MTNKLKIWLKNAFIGVPLLLAILTGWIVAGIVQEKYNKKTEKVIEEPCKDQKTINDLMDQLNNAYKQLDKKQKQIIRMHKDFDVMRRQYNLQQTECNIECQCMSDNCEDEYEQIRD